MKVTWLGHSCFVLESEGYRTVLDPYTLENYPPLHTNANAVLCSHGHRDHNYIPAVTLEERSDCPFTVERIPCFHDEKQGALRGENTIHILSAEGLRVAHLGDLGHELSGQRPLGSIDVLLIPVGGYYTIDAPTAKRVADAVAPRIVVPMHYRHGAFGLRPVGTVDEFLKLYYNVRRLTSNSFSVTPDTPEGVIVPAFCP